MKKIIIGLTILAYFSMSFLMTVAIINSSKISATFENEDKTYLIQRDVDKGYYKLGITGVIDYNYSNDFFIKNSNISICKNNGIISIETNGDTIEKSFTDSKGQVFYSEQNDNKITLFTGEYLSKMTKSHPKKNHSVLNKIYNFFKQDEQLNFTETCDSEACSEVIEKVEDNLSFEKMGEKVKLNYKQQYFISKNVFSENDIIITQNIYIPKNFLIEIDGNTYDVWNYYEYDNYEIKKYEDPYFSKIQNSEFKNYFLNENGKDLNNHTNKLILKKTNDLDSISFNNPQSVKLISPQSQYVIEIKLNSDTIEEIKLDTFANKLLIKSKKCTEKKCIRGFSLLFD